MEKPIRVLHVLAAMDRAGTESLIMNLYRNIDREKVQFDFAVSAEKKCAFDDEIEVLGGKIYHYPRYCVYNHISYIEWWKNFFGKHQEHSIVHGHIGSTAAIYLSIAKKNNKYTIAHSHNTNSKISMLSILYKLYSYPTRYIADFFFGCSKQALIDRYGKKIASSKEKSLVLNNSINVEEFIFNFEKRKQIRQELHIKENEILIGTVGRLSPQKNPMMTISIVKTLFNRGEKFRFLWVGTGEMEYKVKQEISSIGLDSIFILTGVRDDIDRILMGMDVFIFPSLWEGLGISCIEAQASGLPTLCSESVPQDANVSDRFLSLPLDNVEEWCDVIQNKIELIKKGAVDRSNTHQQVSDAGYDIKQTAKWLEDFYIRSKFFNDDLLICGAELC